MCYYFFFFYRVIILDYFFFFSSRRRHTRLQGDWSSDVCSSDLRPQAGRAQPVPVRALGRAHPTGGRPLWTGRPRPGRLQPAQVRAAGAQGPPDRAPAPVRPRRADPGRDRTRTQAAATAAGDPLETRRPRLP